MAREMWKAPAGEIIIGVYDWSYHVPSDNAMIDSGTGFEVMTWDGKQVRRHHIATGREDYENGTDRPIPNATDEQKQAADDYMTAEWAVRAILFHLGDAHKIDHGTMVEVIKGRKVPKGVYEVNAHRTGEYGPYVNLRDKNGKFHNYVAVGNVKVLADLQIKQKMEVYATRHPDLPQFITDMYITHGGMNKFVWMLLAEFIDDHNIVMADKITPAQFAEALRNYVEVNEAAACRVDLSDANWHNNLRKFR